MNFLWCLMHACWQFLNILPTYHLYFQRNSTPDWNYTGKWFYSLFSQYTLCSLESQDVMQGRNGEKIRRIFKWATNSVFRVNFTHGRAKVICRTYVASFKCDWPLTEAACIYLFKNKFKWLSFKAILFKFYITFKSIKICT